MKGVTDMLIENCILVEQRKWDFNIVVVIQECWKIQINVGINIMFNKLTQNGKEVAMCFIRVMYGEMEGLFSFLNNYLILFHQYVVISVQKLFKSIV